MNIKLLHHKNNVVSIINPTFQAIMTIIFEVIAVLVSPYAFGIFSKSYLALRVHTRKNYLALKELIVI